MSTEHANALIGETSPYLLQHAHNPVDWHPWNKTILKRARAERKLLLISIGYSACHWCHVMEKECFEDSGVATLMNANFINIKVDREERPDVDQIYMDALQMMTGQGGWPLNIVALPDGRPFWGATYVKKERWIQILAQLADLYEKNPNKIIGHAQKLAEGIKAINLIENRTEGEIVSVAEIDEAVDGWSKHFDSFLGGYKRAPKFMLPVNLNFLLHYAIAQKDQGLMEYVNTTLTRMAWGGVFDQVGGGFSRYSVDTKWHVPHFEKMLYDNGQLIGLYAKAYAATKNPLYKVTVERTIEFVREELLDDSGGFYSSLDADSLTAEDELEEGAFYVWKTDELKLLLQKDFELFKDYFNINSYGHWENGNYVLIRDASDEEIAEKHNIPISMLRETITKSLLLLKAERTKRKKPGLDDKILTSWNGLMLKGLVNAYRYLGKKEYLYLALKNAAFIEEKVMKKEGSLFHDYKKGGNTINGYLEDYASVIDAFIGLYEATFDEKWSSRARNLTNHCIHNFYDDQSKMFFFTSKQEEALIRRTIEIADNVIPASNSMMGQNLLRLSKLFPEDGYGEMATRMLRNVQENFKTGAPNHAHWMQLALLIKQPFFEVAIVGEDFKALAAEIRGTYLPNAVLTGTSGESDLSLLQNRLVENQTLAYVCLQGTCALPVTKTSEVLAQVKFRAKS